MNYINRAISTRRTTNRYPAEFDTISEALAVVMDADEIHSGSLFLVIDEYRSEFEYLRKHGIMHIDHEDSDDWACLTSYGETFLSWAFPGLN